MSKKLEALECFDKIYNTINLNWQRDLLRVGIDIYNHSDCNDGKEMNNCLDTIKQVLLELQSIKEAKPSEALECLGRIEKYISDRNMYEDLKLESNMYYNGLGIIKQNLIKSQEQEKEIAKYKKAEEELGCPLEVVTHLNWRRPFYYETEDKKLMPILYYEFLQDHITFLITSNNPNKECTTIKLKDYKDLFWLREDKSE